MPLLILFFDAVANFSAYLISTISLGVNEYKYLDTIRQYGEFKDINQSIIKGIFFGYIISAIGTYIGYNTKGGAKGVGISTTRAVVISSISIFMMDYILSTIFLILNW